MGGKEIANYLTYLAVTLRVSASTQKQAFCAIIFLYKEVLNIEIENIDNITKIRRPSKIPTVFSKEEISMVLSHLDGVKWLMACLLYGCGMRLREVISLRILDIDLHYNQIII